MKQPPSNDNRAANPAEHGAQSRQFCGDLDMKIARDGTWFYHGSPIGRKELVRLFASVLTRDEQGEYWLETPVEKGRVEVEDAAFLAVELFRTGEGEGQELSLRTNVDDIISINPDHPLRVEIDPESGEPSPYIKVRGTLEARISRSVYYELVSMGCERKGEHGPVFGVWSDGNFYSLGPL